MFQQDLEKFVHAFNFTILNYRNGVVMVFPKKSIRQLQPIQNAAAVITSLQFSGLFTGFLSLRE